VAKLWSGDEGARLELALVELGDNTLSARGTVVASVPEPHRVEYELSTSAGFVTERLWVRTTGAGWSHATELRHDGRGRWTIDGRGRPDLDGALDCDLAFSLLTNTLPVLREGLWGGEGEPVDMLVAWVDLPGLGVRPSEQRYRLVGRGEQAWTVKFESDGFAADISLDRDGFVVSYPQIGQRVG
jgi:hypothetical protein